MDNPYGESETFASDDHHIGEGLWKLSELVRSVNGSLWIASGGGQYRLQYGKDAVGTGLSWSGVAIEFEIEVAAGGNASRAQQDRLENLAKRLGL